MNTVCRVITGESIAVPYRTAVFESIKSTSGLRPPKLVGILFNQGDNPSRAYAKWTATACEALGIEYQLREISSSSGDVEEAILAANQDDEVDGIMVYWPVFGPKQDSYLQSVVSVSKDVEGLNFYWLYSLYHNVRFIDPKAIGTSLPSTSLSSPSVAKVKAILPCTAIAIVKCLEYCQVYNALLPYGSRLFGRVVTVVNRSEPVGRPLAALLANDGARVFSVDLDGIQEFTRKKELKPSNLHHVAKVTSLTLAECLAISDVVISGVPSSSYKIKTDALKEGVVAINFSESRNFESNIKEKASLYCPGIGKVTIAMLQRNLLRLATEYKSDN